MGLLFFQGYQRKIEKNEPTVEQSTEQASTPVENVFDQGTYLEITQERVRILASDEIAQLLLVGVLYFFPLFLLGFWVGKKGYFTSQEDPNPVLNSIAKTGLIITLLLIGIFIFSGISRTTAPLADLLFRYLDQVLRPVIAFWWVFFILRFYRRGGLRKWLVPFKYVGRMSLSNYLMQSILLTWVFYPYGFNLQHRLPVWILVIFSVSFFALHLLFSRWYLGRYRFGPMEWIWRRLSYGVIEKSSQKVMK